MTRPDSGVASGPDSPLVARFRLRSASFEQTVPGPDDKRAQHASDITVYSLQLFASDLPL